MIASQPTRPMKRAIRHRANTYYALEDILHDGFIVRTEVRRFPTMEQRDAFVCANIHTRQCAKHSDPEVRRWLQSLGR